MTVEHRTPFDKVLESALPAYEIPTDDLVGEVLVPGLRLAEEARIAAGFFSSSCIAQVAPGLAAYLEADHNPIKLLISPSLGPEDREAIARGLRDPTEVLNSFVIRLLGEASQGSANLPAHCERCLSFLVASGKLEIRFVLMDAGMYHKKQWLLRDGDAWIAIHGSGNATLRGLLLNGEQMTVDRTWRDGPSATYRVERFVHQFDRQWHNRAAHSLTVPADQALAYLTDRWRAHEGDPPTTADFWRAWMDDHAAGLEPPLPPNAAPPIASQRLRVPAGLSWRDGRYAHQGSAVDAFLEESQGVFSIATGGGKTKAALISATCIQDGLPGSFLVLILAPSRPLVEQWKREVDGFGIHPVVLSGATPGARASQLDALEAALTGDLAHTEALIATDSLFGTDARFRDWVGRVSAQIPTLLIADEVHNFGAPRFIENKPDNVAYRLGLSATPIRQYDPEGTAAVFGFFGRVLIDFSLGDAIQSGCLVPYDYHVHEVVMTDEEFDRYLELSGQVRRLGFTIDDDGVAQGLSSTVQALLRKRRALLEQTQGKLQVLRDLLVSSLPGRIRRTLIYASAKAPVLGRARQIDSVNLLLGDLGILSHQLTSRETSNSTSDSILAAFGADEYQVLTAMKVLDEGVDIPQTETAVLLAAYSDEVGHPFRAK